MKEQFEFSFSNNANNSLDGTKPPTLSEACDIPITHNHVGTKLIVVLSKMTLLPDEDLQNAVETSHLISK